MRQVRLKYSYVGRLLEDGITSLQYVQSWSILVDPLYITCNFFLVNPLSKGLDKELVKTCKRMIIKPIVN